MLQSFFFIAPDFCTVKSSRNLGIKLSSSDLFQGTLFWRNRLDHLLGDVGPLGAPLGAALRHGRHRAPPPLLLPRFPRHAHLHAKVDGPLEDRLQSHLHRSLLLAYCDCGEFSVIRICEIHDPGNCHFTLWFGIHLLLMIAVHNEPHCSRRIASRAYSKMLSLNRCQTFHMHEIRME